MSATYKIHIHPHHEPCNGARNFYWDTWLQPEGSPANSPQLVAFGYAYTDQSAREQAQDAANRHHNHEPIEEEYTVGE